MFHPRKSAGVQDSNSSLILGEVDAETLLGVLVSATCPRIFLGVKGLKSASYILAIASASPNLASTIPKPILKSKSDDVVA